MRNKGLIVSLTVVITLLCLYYLSFTWKERAIQKDAVAYATETNGNINFTKKQQYLDSVWTEPVYNLFGAKYTLQEVKETGLNLGLDLQGGMHVTLEVSPVEIIESLSAYSKDPRFTNAIKAAQEKQKDSQKPFSSLFLESFQEANPNAQLSEIFANSKNKGRISFDSSNAEVLAVINKEIDQAIDRAFNILRTRIDRFGTSQPNIQRLQGTGRIQIELPGVDNPNRVRKLLQGVAKLDFWEVYEPQAYGEVLKSINDKLVSEMETEVLKSDDKTVAGEVDSSDDLAALTGDTTANQTTEGTQDLDSLSQAKVSDIFTLLRSPYGLVYSLSDTSKINRILNRPDIQKIIPKTMKFLWEVKPKTLASGDLYLELYAIKVGRSKQSAVNGESITNATQEFDQTGKPAVSMQMNVTGAKKWRKLTKESIGKRIAIVLDNYVYSAPQVNSEIPNGSSQISGNFTIEEAKDLANILKSGSLPAPTRIVEEAIIGPTLGKAAQNQGLLSMAAGLGIVIVFMFLYYGKGGTVANIALVINMFFIIGILANLNAALTMSGIAGIVLTIGMSIDANVLIFERIREEQRKGASLMQAIQIGYDRAFWSIFDANLTTFLVGVILFIMGQGPIKGFAITLMIGIATSFFTAVYVTRLIIHWMTKKGDASKFSFDLPWSKTLLTRWNLDFISKRKISYTFSSAFILVGIALMFTQGLNLGVDFQGGRSYVVKFTNPESVTKLKVALDEMFVEASTEVKTFGANNILKVTTTYLENDESDTADNKVKADIVAAIEKVTGVSYVNQEDKLANNDNNFSILSSSKVGPTIADDIKYSSIEAAIFALLGLFLYILIRFRRLQFSAAAVIALAHDILIVFSVFSIANLFGFDLEIDQVFVAAILTVVGYSINDTVIVFDRIREDSGLRANLKQIDIFNMAINNTISRTLITSLTTFVVVLILFLFGGEVLRGFSFALLVGILVGTYSSIFIASPLVLDLTKEKDAK